MYRYCLILITLLTISCGNKNSQTARQDAHAVEASERSSNAAFQLSIITDIVEACLPVTELYSLSGRLNRLLQEWERKHNEYTELKLQLNELQASCGRNPVTASCLIDLTTTDIEDRVDDACKTLESVGMFGVISTCVPFTSGAFGNTDEVLEEAADEIEDSIEDLQRQIEILQESIAHLSVNCGRR